MQQHDRRRRTRVMALPQIALQRRLAGERIFQFDNESCRLRRRRGAGDRAGEREGSD